MPNKSRKNKYVDNRDWARYNEHLVDRGVFFFNPTFLDHWLEEIREMNNGKIGQPFTYPDSLIRFLGMLKAKGFDLRALQGVVQALSDRLGPFPVISYSQIRRRILALDFKFKNQDESILAGCDGTGLKVSNRGEWIRQKWAVRRGWVKVVIMGDVKGNIVDIRIGNENLDERAAGRGMIRCHANKLKKIIMDGYHDCKKTFDLCHDLGIEPVIKIRKNASEKGLGPRSREVRFYKEAGYEKWADLKQYGLRWVATEGIFSAVKRIFGEYVSSHKKRNMYHDGRLKFWAYQQLRDIGN